MTLEECLSKREIINEYDSLNISYQGNKHIINIGDTFGRLQVVKLVQYLEGRTKRKGCICKCNCSENSYIGPSRLYMLLSGDLVSCGCYSSDIHRELMIKQNTIHGDSTRENRSKLYTVWTAMKDRATNTNRNDSMYYADKGIGICNSWLDYSKFKEWAVSHGYKEGLSIERIDVSKGYYPDNCKFIPFNEQNLNKTNSVILEYNGHKLNLSQWCRITGKSYTYIKSRLNSGKPVGVALGYEDD